MLQKAMDLLERLVIAIELQSEAYRGSQGKDIDLDPPRMEAGSTAANAGIQQQNAPVNQTFPGDVPPPPPPPPSTAGSVTNYESITNTGELQKLCLARGIDYARKKAVTLRKLLIQWDLANPQGIGNAAPPTGPAPGVAGQTFPGDVPPIPGGAPTDPGDPGEQAPETTPKMVRDAIDVLYKNLGGGDDAAKTIRGLCIQCLGPVKIDEATNGRRSFLLTTLQNYQVQNNTGLGDL